MLDEPTTGLDPVARHEVLGELMAVLADENRTILFSSHNTLDVEQISDQITFIDRGRIIDSDDKEIFLERWRRLRLQLPPNAPLPSLPGIIEVGGSGRLPVLTTNRFEPAMVSACNELGRYRAGGRHHDSRRNFCRQCPQSEGLRTKGKR